MKWKGDYIVQVDIAEHKTQRLKAEDDYSN